MDYLVALVLTLAVEVPVVALAAGALGARRTRAVAVAIVANLLTHPVLWFVAGPLAADALGLTGLALAELGVVAVEAVVYRLGLRPPVDGVGSFLVSLLANASSFAVGVLLLW